MNNKNIIYNLNSSRLSQNEVLRILQDSDKDFNTPLSCNLDLFKYANKLSENANFILLKEGNNIIGCIAYYLNNDGQFVYIPYFWVNKINQRSGCGHYLLDSLIKSLPEKYTEIKLEVAKDNFKAFSFYNKNGFKIVEDREKKYLLSKKIR